jgi:ADP-heptose:LPS heptosyltransferase
VRLEDSKRILIMRLGAIGDVLRVLPALRRIRKERPDAHIGWAVEHWVYPIVAGHPAVDRFHVLDRRALSHPRRGPVEVRRFVGEARAQAYETTLDFHGRLKSGALTRAIGSPHRVGFARGDATELNHLFTNVHVRLADRWENRVLRFLHLLEPLGIDARYDPSDHGIYVDPETRRASRAWYEARHRPRIACYPGSSSARARERWPEHKWIDLLRRLAKQGVTSVVLWGPDEQQLAADIVAAVGKGCTLAPPTTLPEMMALISCFAAFVGNDTAAMHMAWLQGVPTAAFVGPKPPRTVAPLAPVPSQVLRADEHFVEGLRASRQLDEIVSAVPVGEAFDAVGALLQIGERERVEHGA